jgi:competence protein ComEC
MFSLIFRSFVILLLGLAIVLGVFAYWAVRTAEETRVVFLDVGQGDAILLTRGSNQVLIDGGRSGRTLLAALSRHVPFWDRTIETVIATHPDADHIGGFPELFARYDVETYLDNGTRSESKVFALLETRRSESDMESILARRGLSITFPEGGTLSVLYPNGQTGFSNANAGSVVSRFSFGETDFFLTGDLPEEEKYLSLVEPAEILKVAHHGSKHSTSSTFLGSVRPEEAVISVGKNSYGHPDTDVLSRLAEAGVTVYRTDRDGDVVYRCAESGSGCVTSVSR